MPFLLFALFALALWRIFRVPRLWRCRLHAHCDHVLPHSDSFLPRSRDRTLGHLRAMQEVKCCRCDRQTFLVHERQGKPSR